MNEDSEFNYRVAKKMLQALTPIVELAQQATTDRQPRVKLHLDLYGVRKWSYWWIEIQHIPPSGSFVVPFNDCEEWNWLQNEFKVDDQIYYPERDLVCVFLRHERDLDLQIEPPGGFDEAMIRAGWTKGDREAWL